MLVDFQQALADLTSSPRLCQRALADPELLRRVYSLSDLEASRLQDMVRSAGMNSNCTLYRANRLAPIVLNLPSVSRLLGQNLKPLLTEYWEERRETDVNFLVESARFCEFLHRKCKEGFVLSTDTSTALQREENDLRLRLLAIQTTLNPGPIG